MPKRISANTDMEILAELGAGNKSIDIARKYNVSPSYVSKLKVGKKIPEIYIPSVYERLSQETVHYLEEQIEIRERELGHYKEILNKFKGEK